MCELLQVSLKAMEREGVHCGSGVALLEDRDTHSDRGVDAQHARAERFVKDLEM